MKRKQPTLREIAAAAVLQILDIPHEHAKAMTTDQILSLIQVDHWPVTVAVATANGWGPDQYNHPSNLHLKAILDHRHKTATKDVPEIYKSDRVSEQHEAFRRRMLAKGGGTVVESAGRPKAKIPSKPFPKVKRPMRGRRS